MNRQRQKQQTREAILESASRLLRERGPDGASVSEVMGGAGLTVGGFYAHFASKEQLLAETLQRAARARWDPLVEQGLLTLIRHYLSRSHRDHPAEGCPLPATVSQAEGELRAVLAEELRHYSERVPLGLIALLYGGLSLARAVDGPLSDEILRSCRQFAKRALSLEEP